MGCASSKQGRLDRKSKGLATRSYSLPHNPPKVADGYHVVALTSTTLGSLKLESLEQNPVGKEVNGCEQMEKKEVTDEATEFSEEVLQAKKTWSNMIEEKIPRIPRTPTLTPPNEPEMINAWELMEGLEDSSPLRITGCFGVDLDRSFSFHTAYDLSSDGEKKSKEMSKLHNGCLSPKPAADDTITKSKSMSPSRPQSGSLSPKPGWHNADSMVTEFDPELISAFRKALAEMSPHNGFSLRSPSLEKSPVVSPLLSSNTPEKTSLVKARVSDFQKKIDSKKFRVEQQPSRCPPEGEDKVVLYFTSLRGVRKTYEDCCRVSLILKGFGVRVDERDVSMHHGFREELGEILGEGSRSLPQLFVKSRYLGSADAVKQLHEAGELEKILEDCELVEDGASVCQTCGDVRFINCETCYGSCKVYYEDEEEYDDGDEGGGGRGGGGGGGGGFDRCPDCNEIGIIRCPACCS